MTYKRGWQLTDKLSNQLYEAHYGNAWSVHTVERPFSPLLFLIACIEPTTPGNVLGYDAISSQVS